MKQQYEDLIVWQKAMLLVKEVYQQTKDFPKEETFGITSQIRRAVVSIPLNIAEGKGRFHKKEFIQFLYTARGSTYEVMTIMDICQTLDYLKEEQIKRLKAICGEIVGMLHGLIQSIK